MLYRLVPCIDADDAGDAGGMNDSSPLLSLEVDDSSPEELSGGVNDISRGLSGGVHGEIHTC